MGLRFKRKATDAAAQRRRDWAAQITAQATRAAGDAARFAAEINIGGAEADDAPSPEELGQTAEVLEAAGREIIAAAGRLRPRRRAGALKVAG